MVSGLSGHFLLLLILINYYGYSQKQQVEKPSHSWCIERRQALTNHHHWNWIQPPISHNMYHLLYSENEKKYQDKMEDNETTTTIIKRRRWTVAQ